MPAVVVAAALIERGRVLVAQRGYPPALAGSWELPGGKVDPGERDEDALTRECREELDVEVRLIRRVRGEWRLPPHAVLRVWVASIVSGTPREIEHAALRWVGAEELDDLPWLRADLPLVPHLRTALDDHPG